MWAEEKSNLGRRIILNLYKYGMIRTWNRDKAEGWTLVSGIWSPFYIQLGTLSSYPTLLGNVGFALGRLIREECKNVNKIVGVAMAGIPIAVAVSLSENIPACFTRKLDGVKSLEEFDKFIKSYGEHSIIEGELDNGDVVGIVDDLVRKFDSKLIAIRQLDMILKSRELDQVDRSHVIVLLDQEQGAEEAAVRNGVKLHSLIPFTTKGIDWLKAVLTDNEYEIIRDYLSNPNKFQNPDVQKELYEMALDKMGNR